MAQAHTLAELALGDTADVEAVDVPVDAALGIRLLEMGFVPGTRVRLIKRAPMGDPLVLQLRGFHLSLRRAEAACIRVRRR